MSEPNRSLRQANGTAVDRSIRRGGVIRRSLSLAIAVAITIPLLRVNAADSNSSSGLSKSTPAKPGVSASDDWPWFLGPAGTGITRDAGLAAHWPQSGPSVVWSKAIGKGYSAPSVRGGRLVVHHRQGTAEIIECLRAVTGEPIWKVSTPSDFSDPYGYNNGPRCTPLLTESRCYTFGAKGRLLCIDLETGKRIWERETAKDFQVPQHFFGVGATPILEGNLLIVLVGGQPNSGVVAFNAATGETVWQSVGKATWDGALTGWTSPRSYQWTGDEMVVSYSSPIAATIHGKRHVLCLTRQGLVSLDPKDGHVNFKCWFCSRDYESVNAARPVVIDDKVLLSAAYRVGSLLLQVDPSGQDYKVLWRSNQNLLAHWSTPIALDEFVYGFSGRHEPEGELRCISLKTGKVLWKARGFEGDVSDLALDGTTGEVKDRKTGRVIPFPFFGRGSLTKVGKRFVILGERGTLALAELSPKGYQELSRASFKEIGYPIWPSPVIAGTKLYLRDENTLMCIELGAAK
jgi:outer membrane protein assembly factor BamB